MLGFFFYVQGVFLIHLLFSTFLTRAVELLQITFRENHEICGKQDIFHIFLKSKIFSSTLGSSKIICGKMIFVGPKSASGNSILYILNIRSLESGCCLELKTI